MEDQSADSGDLTTEAASASVPQGKAARSRHRLPRQRARQFGEIDQTDGHDAARDHTDEPTVDTPTSSLMADTVEASPADAVDTTVTEPEATAPAEAEPEPDSEPVDETEPKPVEEEPAPQAAKRRRLPWRREKTPVPAATEVDETRSTDADVGTDDAVSDDAVKDETVVDETGKGETGTGETAQPDVVLVPHRPAGRLLKTIAVEASVLFVAAGAFAGATIQPYLADRAAVQEKFEIAETAASAISTLWTYTPDDMDRLADRSAKFLSNDFATEYRNYIDGIAATNKQAQVTNSTQVLGAAVESLSATDATALVYTNSVATSPLTKGIPSLRYFAYRLSLVRDGSRWLVTQMVAVTKLDLTPRL